MRLVRERRLAQGWSQQVLGNRVGCTKQHISDLEHGKVEPSLRMLRQLAQALNVSAADLLTDSIADICPAPSNRALPTSNTTPLIKPGRHR